MSRTGKLSLIQIVHNSIISVVDVVLLENDLTCLKDILESDKVIKFMWDGRTDCDVFKHCYNINVDNVYDLQVAEVFARRKTGHFAKYTLGITKAIGYAMANNSDYKSMYIAEMEFREKVREMYNADKNMWDKRPLMNELLIYSVNDMKYMPILYKTYSPYSNEANIIKISMNRINKRRDMIEEVVQSIELARIDF
jgi:hypothetical protein